MQGPRAPQTWTAQTPARSYGTLIPGRRYEVLRPFVDYDGDTHAPGERWTFLGSNFLPYDDGLSLFVSLDGKQEWHIRLQDRPEEQAAIIATLAQHMVEVKENDAGSPPPIPATPAVSPGTASSAARSLAVTALPGVVVGAVAGYAIAVSMYDGEAARMSTAIALGGALAGLVVGVLLGLRMHAARQWQALRAAVPIGLPAASVEALLGKPDRQMELFPSSAAAATWTYVHATFAGIRLRSGTAVDFDRRDRVLDVRRLRGWR